MVGYYMHRLNYVKKEDAKRILTARRYSFLIITISVSLIALGIRYLVLPQFLQILIENGYRETFLTSHFVELLAGFNVINLVLTRLGGSDSELDEKLKRYKSGEMILGNDLINKPYELLMTIICAIFLFYSMYVVIHPVYEIVNLY